MHGLVDAAHVDHLHPDAGIALAAADGEQLTKALLWRPGGLGAVAAARVPARPGHRRRSSATTRGAIGVILGGHGITAWGATSAECEARSLEIIATAQRYLDAHGKPEPFGPVGGCEPLPEAEPARPGGRARPADPGPGLHRPAAGRPLHRLPGCSTSWPGAGTRAGRARHLLPGSLPAHQGRPLVLDLPPDASPDGRSRLRRAARRTTARTTAPTTSGTRRPSPPMRGADPAIVLVPGVGMFSFGADNRPPGWRASSTSTRST